MEDDADEAGVSPVVPLTLSLPPARHHALLDLDQTLIDSFSEGAGAELFLKDGYTKFQVVHIGGWEIVFERPHLSSFLLFVFSEFAHVALWTRASQEWLDSVLAKSPTLSQYKHLFSFLWTGDKCSTMTRHHGFQIRHKPFKKNWTSEWGKQAGMGRSNSLLVDDKPINAVQNFGNFVHVPAFDGSKRVDRDVIPTPAAVPVLLSLVAFFRDTLLPRFGKTGDFRPPEKRAWWTGITVPAATDVVLVADGEALPPSFIAHAPAELNMSEVNDPYMLHLSVPLVARKWVGKHPLALP